MSFEPQNQLETALRRAADDPAHRPQFYRDFIGSDVFIIQHGPAPATSGRMVTPEGFKFEIQPIEIGGKEYLPIFSSLRCLQAVVQSSVGYLALNARTFLEITRGAAVMLNPGSDYGKELSVEEIASILDGSIWQSHERYVAQGGEAVELGQPANYPGELVEALKRFFRQKRQVRRAWLAQFFNHARDERAHTLVAIEVTGDWDQIVGEAGMVARGVNIPDPPLDFMRITGGRGLQDYFTRRTKPFYERRWFGLA